MPFLDKKNSFNNLHKSDINNICICFNLIGNNHYDYSRKVSNEMEILIICK